MQSKPSDDEAAILKVIDADHQAFWKKDLEAIAALHVQAPYARRWAWWLPDVLVIREGWSSIKERLGRVLEDPAMPNGIVPAVTREHLNIRIGTDMAWVTFDQSSPAGLNREVGIAGTSRDLRILEKHEGAWKIAMTAFANRQTPLAYGLRFRVNEKGHVLWRSAEAEHAMIEGCGLFVKAGRLRARDAKADKRMYAAIQWAATQPGGFEARREALPLVTERHHEGGAEIWWVVAEAGVIQVIGHPQQIAEEHLAAAAIVYGLSKSQVLLARAILEGKGLPQAAAATDITLNTARTHLRRMFDKTGVRTQAALVRCLLAVASPP
jgi:DNA-binding CsgD family transcriptional regulator